MQTGSTLGFRTTILNHLIKIVPGLEVEQAYSYLHSCSDGQLDHLYAMIVRKEYLALRELFKPYFRSIEPTLEEP